MKNILKIVLSLVLVLSIVFSFSACSSKTEMTEENVEKTVEIVTAALKNFDEKALKKYVDSDTLDYIINFAEDRPQFADLGRAIFQNLEVNIESIDLNNQTVTVNVRNKDLITTASVFAGELKSNYTTFQLLDLLKDNHFLDTNLAKLVEDIGNAYFDKESTVTLKIKQGKHNLILAFDEEGEDAVSGGALSAIKSIYS